MMKSHQFTKVTKHKNNNVVLVGFMASGKTTIGKKLAQEFGLSFYDTDHELKRLTGVEIPVIFDIEGEQGFRDRETKVLGNFVDKDNIILATGGGSILRDENIDLLKKIGIIVHLLIDFNVMLERIKHDKSRPLLQNKKIEEIEALYQYRMQLYQSAADIEISSNESFHSICKTFREFLC